MAALIKKFSDAVHNDIKTINCWGSGNPLREFLHTDDLASAAIFALEQWDPKAISSPKDINGNPLFFLNVGTGKDISIKDLADKILKITKFKGNIVWDKSKPDGTFKKQLDTSRINSLGWESKISLTEGIKKTIKEYREIFL